MTYSPAGGGMNGARGSRAQQERGNLEASQQARTSDAAAENQSEKLTFDWLSKTTSGPTGTLSYPRDLKTAADIDYVRFKFKKYTAPFSKVPEAPRGSLSGYNDSAINLQDDAAYPAILLYMPEDISATYGVEWGGKSIQNITRDILSASDVGGTIKGLFKNFQDKASNALDATITEGVRLGLEALQKTGQGEGLNINDVFGSTKGIVLNPNTELLFAGFNLRTFNLAFKMVARNQPEATEIRNIITCFKKAMLPSLTLESKFTDEERYLGTNGDRSNFINVPHLVDVRYMLGSNVHPYLTQFKPCAITGLNVNYTGDGTYATYKNGEPVAVTLQLQFSETKLVYSEDIRFSGPSF